MTQAFLDAVKSGDIRTVEGMLAADPKLKDTRTKEGIHAAVLALYYGKADVATVILAAKPTLDLHSAATAGDFARVKEIVEKDPTSVGSLSPDGFPPLGLAAYMGHRPIVGYLLNKGADVNQIGTDRNRFTALTGAVAEGHADVVEVLLAHGADANYRYEGGNTPLTEAAFTGDPRIVRLLLDHGADVHVKTEKGQTPLSLALEKGHADVADVLRTHGARA